MGYWAKLGRPEEARSAFCGPGDRPVWHPIVKEKVSGLTPKASLGLSYPAGVLKEIQSTLEGDRG